MTAQQLLVASLDYRHIIAKMDVPVSIATIRYTNGLIEYLCARAAIEDHDELPEAGIPYQQDVEEVSHEKGNS